MHCPVTSDLNRYLDSVDAADHADKVHADAVAEWKREVRSSELKMYDVLKSYAEDCAHDHAELLVSACLDNARLDLGLVDSFITSALDYALVCGDGPKYRTPYELAAERRAEIAEARRDARDDR